MVSADGKKCVLHVLNSLSTIFGLALACGSLWFYVQVVEFTSLRNANHYLLDYNVYWPQAIPWMFVVVGLFTVAVAGCGFSGVRQNKKGTIDVYVICLGVAILLLLAAAIIAFVFADSKATDDFIKDTVWDAYQQSRADTTIQEAYGSIEKKLHCCGALSPRDYRTWKNEFPRSCCDTYYHGWIGSYILDCDFTNKLANERYGCATVASEYSRISIIVLAVAALVIAVICIISLIVGLTFKRSIRNRPRVIHVVENGSNKGLLQSSM